MGYASAPVDDRGVVPGLPDRVGPCGPAAAREGRVDDDLVVGAVAALTVHACYVMAAVFNTVELRYAAAMWPFQAVYGLVLVR